MRIEDFSPNEFLRARRPERFSDSFIEEELELDRSMLEYHLSTLTSRKEEYQFERFAQRLAEREICPNLLPQTGPTGGGDSKVDSETYPVADDLSLLWYTGIGREASSERWAFAFSAKKKWRGKVRSDIAKLVETGRGYEKAFYVTNQFIRDKTRAEMEDELRKEHDLDVRILDRTWILDKVFCNSREALAIEELELTTSTRKVVRKGPLDVQRSRELEKLEQSINEAAQEQRFSFSFVDDCIDAAILSRRLERSRLEVEGRFERAERVSSRYGTSHQRLQCAYQRAWTAFWWYEDYEHFVELYATVEERAKGSRNPYHLELITNLWHLLPTALREGGFDETETLFQVQTETLREELERLGEEDARPSASLQARALLLQMQILLKLHYQEPIESVLREFQEVVRQSEELAGYPLRPQVDILMELGEFLEGVPAYDELFETIVEVVSAREGEISGARMLLSRGEDQLESDRPYDAIRLLGRAFRSLYRHESRHDCVRALYLCGCAYERVGLLWAARGTLLAAASISTDELWRYGEVTPLQAMCYGRLKWIELQLGRLPHILAWHKTDSTARSVLADQGYNENHLTKGSLEFDLTFGILFLKTEVWELKWLSALPDVLEYLGLSGASTALIYALGHEEIIQDTAFCEVWAGEDLYEVFLKWRDQPASDEIAPSPLLCNGRKVGFSSAVLGCRVTVESENDSPCVELAESILAGLESFLSTGTLDEFITYEPTLTVTIRKSDFAKRPFEFELQDQAGRPHVDIACSAFDPHSLSLEAQKEIKEQLIELLIAISSRITLIRNADRLLERLFRDECAIDRSIGFTGSFVTVGNVLGHEPQTRIASWYGTEAKEYPLMRSQKWDADDACTAGQKSLKNEDRSLTTGEGEPPSELVDPVRMKHTQIQTVSLIRETLWEDADWCGTAFFFSLDGPSPPGLAPVFSGSEKAAKQIFAQWRSELGIHDPEKQLRVSVVRGIDETNPYAYRVAIGVNPEVLCSKPSVQYALLAYRTNTMEPASSVNLEKFLQSYETFGSYYLVPAIARRALSESELLMDYYLVKRELYVREAWEIGRHDVDSVAIFADDVPIIPAGQENPPVLSVLRWKREKLSPYGGEASETSESS